MHNSIYGRLHCIKINRNPNIIDYYNDDNNNNKNKNAYKHIAPFALA